MSNSSQFQKIHTAYCAGDLLTIREILGNPTDFPNCRQPYELAIGNYPLEYAIYWSPLEFIQTLLDLGADSNYPADDGFPALIALLSSSRSDKYEVLKILLENGADPNQRGINDWTPLHYAVSNNDLLSIVILLEYGADSQLKTRIDDCTSPLEDARTLEFDEAVKLLEK